VTVVSAVLLLGTLWYRFVEEWTVPEALYLTVIMPTTVGLGEVFSPS
jgi:voltage-gated potassium channel